MSNSDLRPQASDFRLPPPRIVFMGTPEFAVASLDALVKAGGNIVGVITAPDNPPAAHESSPKARKTIRRCTRSQRIATGKTKEPRLSRHPAGIAGRYTGSGGLPHAARTGVEYASHGHHQPARLLIAAIPRRGAPSTGR